MIRLLPVPDGWDALERHLLDWHGLDLAQVNALDADGARRLHAYQHSEHVSMARRHEHA